MDELFYAPGLRDPWLMLRQDYIKGKINERVFIQIATEYYVDNFEVVKAVQERRQTGKK